jgi:hypothetical protein
MINTRIMKFTKDIIENQSSCFCIMSKGQVLYSNTNFKKMNERERRTETENIISKIFPKRALAKIPPEFRGSPKPKKSEEIDTVEPVVVKSKPSKLLWTSGPLSQRDLNIPKGSNTNPTGSMLFKKGKTEGIDQRHYFRDEVFSALTWTKDINEDTAHLERATHYSK